MTGTKLISSSLIHFLSNNFNFNLKILQNLLTLISAYEVESYIGFSADSIVCVGSLSTRRKIHELNTGVFLADI